MKLSVCLLAICYLSSASLCGNWCYKDSTNNLLCDFVCGTHPIDSLTLQLETAETMLNDQNELLLENARVLSISSRLLETGTSQLVWDETQLQGELDRCLNRTGYLTECFTHQKGDFFVFFFFIIWFSVLIVSCL